MTPDGRPLLAGPGTMLPEFVWCNRAELAEGFMCAEQADNRMAGEPKPLHPDTPRRLKAP